MGMSMSQVKMDVYSSGIGDFINQVMLPLECLENILIKTDDNRPIHDATQGSLLEIGVVHASLTAHAKHRLNDAFRKIEEMTGTIKIIQGNYETVHIESVGVKINGQDSYSVNK